MESAISKHLKNIFESGELIESSVHSILEYTAADGNSYKTKFYNLMTGILGLPLGLMTTILLSAFS